MSTAPDERHPFVVTLTGGIASGKTAVSDRFARLGVPVVDTDVIARELVQAGQPLLEKIVGVFGPQVLNQEGQLDRKRMRELIFTDPGRKQRLEAILHPAIRERVQEQLRALHSEYCLLVVPLLAESGSGRWGDRVLVVDVDEETQLARVTARDQIGRKQALAILNSQATRQQRLALADDVIHNYGSLAELDRAVHALHDQYLELARLRQPGAGRGPLDSGMRRNDG
jgi:dephospho-CoA kinase